MPETEIEQEDQIPETEIKQEYLFNHLGDLGKLIWKMEREHHTPYHVTLSVYLAVRDEQMQKANPSPNPYENRAFRGILAETERRIWSNTN